MIHGTCIHWLGTGILLLGESGSGKSDFALRCIEKGAKLVADDQVILTARKGALFAEAPSALVGLIEIRQVGIVRIKAMELSPVSLIVHLKPAAQIERLPCLAFEEFLDCRIPSYSLAPFENSAPLKLYHLLKDVAINKA